MTPELRPHCWGALAVVAAASIAVSAQEPATSPRVKITGGFGADGYSWSLTNQHSVPIAFVEFPHYHADMFEAPKGWKTECTYLVNVGVPDRPGICSARAETPDAQIRKGESQPFKMRIANLDTRNGRGKVTIEFADGTREIVGDVELPVPFTILEKQGPLIGFAAIIAIVILIQVRRRRKNRLSTPTVEPPEA